MTFARLSPRNHAGDQESRPSRLIPTFLLAALSGPDTRSRRPSPRKTNLKSEAVIVLHQGRPMPKNTKSSARKPSGKDSQPTLSLAGNHVAGVDAAVHHLRHQQGPSAPSLPGFEQEDLEQSEIESRVRTALTSVPRRVWPHR